MNVLDFIDSKLISCVNALDQEDSDNDLNPIIEMIEDVMRAVKELQDRIDFRNNVFDDIDD